MPTRRQIVMATAVLVFAPGLAVADDLTPPETVVSELLAAMEVNDAYRIRTVFAEDASHTYGDRSPKTGEDFRAWLASDIIEPHGRVDGAELAGDGNAVVVTGQYRNDDGYSSAADFLMTVEDGRIISWQMRY
ncbi:MULTISPECIES: nuclear transport factor 2 family protein [unclassified Roseovarius]|uniref:nuclear transport factor 2 family protein n=1 Tax=unclassified Roseovarius TaxID=2614913 RepID=UPI00273F3AE8|nr:nuclear transport factor 2 family protein [Roseovarius sp. MMSF_3350]